MRNFTLTQEGEQKVFSSDMDENAGIQYMQKAE